MTLENSVNFKSINDFEDITRHDTHKRALSTEHEGATLVFRNVCVTLQKNDILKDVYGMAKVGQMLAIMGPSGAGKSTLLNTLTGRNQVKSGSITLNGHEVTRSLRRKISYVLQQDAFYPNLTLKETLTFAMMLRLPEKMPRDLKDKRLQEIVDVLELNKCINTKMGDGFSTGLSGGERKRASIATELFTNPKIIVLDEPTSGLDSAIAFSLMVTLARYAKLSQKTVVTTIHQPASQIFHLFTNVLLLTEGEVAYFGRGNKITDFFASLGLHCDPQYNPADFIIEQVKLDKETVKRIVESAKQLKDSVEWPNELRGDAGTLTEVKVISSQYSNQAFEDELSEITRRSSSSIIPPAHIEEVNVDEYMVDDVKWQTGFVSQYTQLTKRAFLKEMVRFYSKLNIIHLVMAILAGMEWWQLPREEDTAQDRLGILFFVIIQNGFIPMQDAIFQVFDPYGVFVRERSSGIYRLTAYYLAVMTSEIPFFLILSIIFVTILYFMSGLMVAAYNYFLHLLMLIVCGFLAQSFGYFTGVLISNPQFLVPIGNAIIIASLLTGGFYNTHLAAWFAWFKYLSYMTYGLTGLAFIEYTQGTNLQCANVTSYPEYCHSMNDTMPGSAFVARQKLDILPLWACFLVLFGAAIFFRIISYFILRYLRRPIN